MWPRQDQLGSLSEFDICMLGKEDFIFFDINELSKQYRLGIVGVGDRGIFPLYGEKWS